MPPEGFKASSLVLEKHKPLLLKPRSTKTWIVCSLFCDVISMKLSSTHQNIVMWLKRYCCVAAVKQNWWPSGGFQEDSNNHNNRKSLRVDGTFAIWSFFSMDFKKRSMKTWNCLSEYQLPRTKLQPSVCQACCGAVTFPNISKRRKGSTLSISNTVPLNLRSTSSSSFCRCCRHRCCDIAAASSCVWTLCAQSSSFAPWNRHFCVVGNLKWRTNLCVHAAQRDSVEDDETDRKTNTVGESWSVSLIEFCSHRSLLA